MIAGDGHSREAASEAADRLRCDQIAEPSISPPA
jgi:hypothetical protein